MDERADQGLQQLPGLKTNSLHLLSSLVLADQEFNSPRQYPRWETYDVNLGHGGFLYLSDNSDGLRVLNWTGKGMSGK